jgi:hypothetical protein
VTNTLAIWQTPHFNGEGSKRLFLYFADVAKSEFGFISQAQKTFFRIGRRIDKKLREKNRFKVFFRQFVSKSREKNRSKVFFRQFVSKPRKKSFQGLFSANSFQNGDFLSGG